MSDTTDTDETERLQFEVVDDPESSREMTPVKAEPAFNALTLMPPTFELKMQMATVLAKSGLLPAGLDTPEKVAVVLEYGHELQLPPMVSANNIAVVNGKPTLSADIMLGIAKRSPEYGGIEWLQEDASAAKCIITRCTHGITERTTGQFDMKMAVAAGLTGKDNWKKYPARMLKHRALAFACRDAFPDLLAGIYITDEIENISRPEPRNITPAKNTEQAAFRPAGRIK